MSDSVVQNLQFYLNKFGLLAHNYQNFRRKNFFGRYRKYVLVSARLFHAVHYTFCMVRLLKGFFPKHYFDFYRTPILDMGSKMFFYIIIITYNLFFGGVLYLFNFSPKCDNHWITMLRELVGHQSIELSKEIKKKIIARVKFALKFIPIGSISMNIGMIALALPLMIATYDIIDFIIYGVPSILLVFNTIRPLIPLGMLAALCVLIPIQYFYQRFKQLNERFKYTQKNKTVNQSLIKHLNVEHNLICKRIHSSNRFWKKVYVLMLLTVLPSNLFIFYQLVFGKMANFFLFYTILIGTIEAVGLSSLAVLAPALLYRESKKVHKNLTKILIKFPMALSNRIKVSDNAAIVIIWPSINAFLKT